MKQVILLLFAMAIISCNQVEQETYTVLSGTIENMDAEKVYLEGPSFSKEIAITNNSFSDTLHLKANGFYDLYVDRLGSKIYLEKGSVIDVNFDVERADNLVLFEGDLKNENHFLSDRDKWSQENTDQQVLFSLSEADFKKALKENQSELEKLIDSYEISSDIFKKMLADEDIYYNAILTENYENAYRYFSGDRNFEVSDNFYEELNKFDFNDTLAFRNSVTYQDLVKLHYNRVVGEDANMGDSDYTLKYMNKIDSDFPDGYAKDQLMHDHLKFWLKPDETMTEVFEIYKNSNPDAENLANVTQRYELLKELMPGNPSPGFDYENFNGGTTSLEDLRGKYVYIDVWATWCGPCLREIPSLQEVERDYKDKNIQIVSISIDEEKDYDKWRQMITDRSLGGLQLMADKNWNSQLVQDYGILGIPRFILIDPEGNIVSADAPRPSNPSLRAMLDELL